MKSSWPGTLVALCLSLAVGGAAAEDGPAGVESPAPASERFIPVPQIPERTESLQQALRRLSSEVSAKPQIVAIESDLLELRAKNAERVKRTQSILEGRPTLDKLGDVERDWSRRLSLLSSHRKELAKRASSLEGDLARLSSLDEVWTRTLGNARTSGVPQEVLDSLATNLNGIAGVADQVRERRALVLTLLTSASAAEFEVTEMIQEVSRARAVLRSRILEPDSAPLWSTLSTVDWSSIGSRIRVASKKGRAEVEEFASAQDRFLIPIILTFGVFLFAATYVRGKLRRTIPGLRLEGSARIFERPYSVAVVMTVLVGIVAFPSSPRLLRDFIGVALVLPLIRVLRPVVPAASGYLVAVLAAFFVTDRVREVIAPAELLERLLFLAETLGAISVVSILLRSPTAQVLPRDGPPRAAMLGLLRLSLLAFVLSAGGNLLGYVGFARFFGEGALGSIYLAGLAYAAYRIATTLAIVGVSSGLATSIRVLQSQSDQVIAWSKRSFGLAAFLLWTLATLDGFAIREPILAAGRSLFFTPLEVGVISVSLWDVLALPLVIAAAVFLSRGVRAILDADVFTRIDLGRGVGNAVSTSVHYALLLGGFFLAIGAAGIDLGRFAILAGAFGVGIGFGLQNVVNNFVSGLILLYERPIQVGDNIELGGLLGEVKQIGIRASTVLTFQGAEVIVPNADLLSDQLVNWTLSNRHRRVELPVGVAYGNKPAEVIEVLERVLDRETRILREPRPSVLFRGFGDSSLNFEVRFWAPDYLTYVKLASDVGSAVYDELEREGISIPFPQRDLHLKSVDDAVAQRWTGGGDGS